MADKMGDNDLERVDSYQYPAAHIGHLNDVQQKRLEEFKELAAKKGYYAPAGQNGANVASHDDATMLYVYPELSSGSADIVKLYRC